MDESRMRALVQRFLGQVEEAAPRIARAIVDLERRSDDADALKQGYDAIARDIHGLKGTAAMLALTSVADLAHRTEDVVRAYRGAGRAFGPGVADRMLEASDAFLSLVRARVKGDAAPPVDALMATLAEAAASVAGTAALPKPAEPPQQAQTQPTDVAAPDGAWRVEAARVEALVRSVEGVREIFQRMDEHSRDLGRFAKGLGENIDGDVRARIAALGRALAFTSREANSVAETLEEDLKALATMPAHTILGPMHRAVRDLCRKHGKEANLSVVGGEHSLDRGLLGSLAQILTHLVRNAIDHGLEMPDVRERAGKNRTGAIVIRVEQQGNVVMLELSDDGGGIDVERVRRRAVEAGLAPAADLAARSADEISRLIFEDGLSTREEATETSGRGVGLAAVRQDVDKVGGHIDLWSRAGQGTRFVVVLPVSLGSTPVVVVRAGEQLFGVPLMAIETARSARAADFRIGWDDMKLVHKDELLPVHDLAGLLGLREAQPPAQGQLLFVVAATEGRAAVLVDEVIGDRELVLRSLPTELRGIPAYQGVGMLALREAVLVCKPAWLVGPHAHARATGSAPRRALVVDDSLAARAMHRTILEAAGYVVHTASSGVQALQRVARARYEAVVSDIGMDGMDGIALTKALRSRPETRDVSIVIVTASDAPEERGAAMAAGADAFLNKSDCASGRLVAALERARGSSRRAS